MKYIVEFEDEPSMYVDEVHFYKCIQAPWWGLSEEVIKYLTPYQPDAPDTNVGNITNSCAHENDPISRQMAIDTIMGQPPEPHYPSWYVAQIEKLPAAQPEPKWIPCSERLPETYGAYLVQDVWGYIFVDHWRGGWLAKTTMVAWMPLPEPYRGGEK